MRTSVGIMAVSLWAWIVLSGFSCGPTLKNCKEHSDCSTDQRCRSYSCQLLDHCSADSDCHSPRSCVKNRCMEPKEICKSNKDCPSGSVCDGGICGTPKVSGCKNDRDCLSSEICSQQKCIPDPGIPCAKASDCSGPYVCIQNRCKKPTTGCQSNNDCKAPQVCSKGLCAVPSVTCKVDRDCKTGEACKNSTCVTNQVGICRLSSSVSTLSFSALKAGESKQRDLTLSNKGTGACQISQIQLRDQQSAVGVFSLAKTWPAQTLSAGKSIVLKVTFQAKIGGILKASLDVFSGGNVLRTVSLFASVTKDTTIPSSGWATVLYQPESDAAFFSGCFWDNNTFEVASGSAFREGGFNGGFGNLKTSSDNGVTWKCANCVQGQSWPRTAHHEIVDMTLSGLSCLKDRAYVYGSFFDVSPNGDQTTLFTRTSKTNWTPVRDKNHPLNNSASPIDRIYTWDNRWFMKLSSLLFSFVPEPDGLTQKQSFLYVSQIKSGTSYNQDFHVAHQVGVLTGFRRVFANQRVTTEPYIVYNTTNAVLPKGAKPADQAKYLKDATIPCTDCTLRKVRVIDAQTFLIAGTVKDAARKTSSLVIWRTSNRGTSWKKVYERKNNESDPVYASDILALSSKRILFVGGSAMQNLAGSDGTGVLLESNDGGQTFQPIPVSKLKGKSIRDGKLPALLQLKLSPDQKTLFVLGSGIILRWKP